MPRYLVERSIPHANVLTSADLKTIVHLRLRVHHELEAEIQFIDEGRLDDSTVKHIFGGVPWND